MFRPRFLNPNHIPRKIQLYMDLTSTCDIHCVHCFREVFTPEPAKIGRSQIRILEREVFPYVSRLALSETGESLYVRVLPEALSAAKRANVPFIHIQTNGVHLNPKTADMLLNSGLTILAISLDAAKKRTFEQIRRGSCWETVIENIRMLVEQRRSSGSFNLGIALNFAIMKQNVDEAVEVIQLAKDLGVDSVTFTHLFIERSEMKEWSLIYDPAQANRLCAKLRAKSEELSLPIATPPEMPGRLERFNGTRFQQPVYHGYCTAAHDSWIFLRSNGNCYPCFNLQDQRPLGNIFKTPFPKIWRSRKNRRFRKEALKQQRVPGCDHCKFFTKSHEPGSELTYLAKRLTTVGVVGNER